MLGRSLVSVVCLLAATTTLTVADSATSFKLGTTQLTDSRWLDTQDRTLSYLKFIDLERLLWNYRTNHDLDTQGAQPNGGWDAPDADFRGHTQGHFLSAWAQCYAALGDQECGDRATYIVEELAKCQDNNEKAGYHAGYLSGFHETEFTKLENGTLNDGNVPYYVVHKMMAGLYDTWQYVGDDKARDVLLSLADWVDWRTGQLSEDAMQQVMQTEFGGMNDILAMLYQATGDRKWLTTAQRFDHKVVFDPLADDADELDGLHANTQIPKFVGAFHEWQATNTQRYLDIAKNAWDIITSAHSYAIGGNSQAEHFHGPNAIAQYLTNDTCETCNSYNMLKLTRELWSNDPSSSSYFDFYETTLLNHLLGAQDPTSDHGHITYFTPLNPGGRRGVGPGASDGWSDDYESFWCCQSSSLETFTKLMDSIYWYEGNDTLYVNLFIPSKLSWKDKGVTVTQKTSIPETDSTAISVEGSGKFNMQIRIPDWTTSDARVLVNGESDDSVTVKPGAYASIDRDWADGDTVTAKFPMEIRTIPANDDKNTAALAFGPTVLAADYGDSSVSDVPDLTLDSVKRSGDSGLKFEATAGGKTVNLEPFYDSHGYNYNVYWKLS